jgi:pyruvate oxidase
MSDNKSAGDNNSAPVLTFHKDGPIRVEGLDRFLNSRGEAIAVKKVIAICRCGASRNKPFCDGTHGSIGFTDEKSPDRAPDQLDQYQGKEVTIRDNRGICSHAAYCTRERPKVWRTGVEPWIDPDGESSEDAIEVIRKCPSGALSYEQDGEVHDVYSDIPEIQISRNGPYQVRGGAELQDVDRAEGASLEHCALCRCGASKNKPFCDGRHWYAAFKDDEALTISKANHADETDSQEWIGVGKSVDLEPEIVHSVAVGERSVALVRTDSTSHALDGRCPHQGGPLTEGTLCDGAIRCPWHGYDFSLETGKGVGNELSVERFDSREVDGQIEIAVPQSKRSTWTVSHVIAETMVEWGVDSVFGMVGHSNLGMAEAIRVQEEKGRLRYIGVRHEGAAAFACSGYAKLSGRPAACLSIAGPGATNLLTGLWDARMDRAPVLALTGQVNTQVLGPGAFQEIDLSSAFEAVSRFSQTVLPDSRHAELTALALKNAIVERDVAHLILPDEVQVLDAGNEGPAPKQGRVSPTAITPPPVSLDYAFYRIANAKRPVIIAGYGARHGMDEVIRLAQALGSPVITTFKGKGLISDDHPLGAGVLGRSGTPVASWFMNQADLLVTFGASFSNHTGIATDKPIIQVDFDRMALGKFHGVDEPVWGDIDTTARLLRERLPEQTTQLDQRPELAERWADWRTEKRSRAARDEGNGLNSAAIFDLLARTVPEDAVLSVDVGNNTYFLWALLRVPPTVSPDVGLSGVDRIWLSCSNGCMGRRGRPKDRIDQW